MRVVSDKIVQEVVNVRVVASFRRFCEGILVIVIVTRRLLLIRLIIYIKEVLSCLLESPPLEGRIVNNIFIKLGIDFILIRSELPHFSLIGHVY